MALARNAVMLMPWGRVGSNMVNDIIRLTGRIVHNEPLTGVESASRRAGLDDAQIAAAQAEWLRNNLEPGGAPWFMNLAALSVAEPETTADYLQQFDPVWIILDRRDVPATVLSSLRVEAWVAEGDRIGEYREWAIPRGQNRRFSPVIAPDDLRRVMRYVDLGRERMERMVRGHRVRRYWYEDILLDLQGTVSDILHQIGLGSWPPVALSGRFGADRLADMVANPAALAAVIRETRVETRLILPDPDAIDELPVETPSANLHEPAQNAAGEPRGGAAPDVVPDAATTDHPLTPLRSAAAGDDSGGGVQPAGSRTTGSDPAS